jgi:hypothetical protein
MMRRHIAVLLQTDDDTEVARILQLAAERFLAGSNATGGLLYDTDGEVCGEVKILFVGVPS